jgi:hypothetical protein
MAIALACPQCASNVSVTAEMAGKRARCPQCRMELMLPRTLIELPDRFGEEEPERPRPPARSSALLWVGLAGGALLVFAVLCGGPIGVLWYLLRGSQQAAEMAEKVVVQAPGVNLPTGAPPRAMRVTEFEGVFQKRDQLINGDVPFKRAGGGGGVNKSHVCKEYVIDLEAGRTYDILLEGPQFDSYLRLADLNGRIIQEDDDSGGGLNSRIIFTPVETKSYLVVATTLGGGFGPYTLTLRDTRFKKPR